VKAARNEKTIEITLHFFTDCLDDDAEMMIPVGMWHGANNCEQVSRYQDGI